jgi:hypothetical protein
MGWTSIDGYNSQDSSSHLHCCCCWIHPVREWKMGASKQGSPCLEQSFGFRRIGTSTLGPRLSSSTKEDAQQLLRHRVSGVTTADSRDSSVGVGPLSQFIFFWTSVFGLLLLLRSFSLSPNLLRSLGILSTFRHDPLTSLAAAAVNAMVTTVDGGEHL